MATPPQPQDRGQAYTFITFVDNLSTVRQTVEISSQTQWNEYLSDYVIRCKNSKSVAIWTRKGSKVYTCPP
jgi:hypothetical protein